MMNLYRASGFLAHQVGDRALGVSPVVVGHGHAEEAAPGGVEGGLVEKLGGHLPQPFEPGDVRLGVLGQFGQDPVAAGVVGRPLRFLAVRHLVERRAGQVDPPFLQKPGRWRYRKVRSRVAMW